MKKYSGTICFLLLALMLFSCAPKTPWNPYLSMKVKPSEQQMRENNEVIAAGNRAYKKQLEKNKQNIRANNAKAMSMKRHYHYKHKKVKKQKKIRR